MRVYDDKHGWFVTVRPDRDHGEACEIAWNDGGDAVQDERTITMPWPMARLVAEAIIQKLPTPEPRHD
jgi:hypothetical protein